MKSLIKLRHSLESAKQEIDLVCKSRRGFYKAKSYSWNHSPEGIKYHSQTNHLYGVENEIDGLIAELDDYFNIKP